MPGEYVSGGRRKKRIVLFNPNSCKSTTAEMVAVAEDVASEWADIEERTAQFGASVILTLRDLDVAREAVLGFSRLMAVENWPAEAIVIAAFGDPGLRDLKECCPLPVTGIGESGIMEAGRGGRAFSIVTTTPDLEMSILKQVEGLGFASQLRTLRLTPGVPEEVMASPERLDAELGHLIDIVVARDGAQAVLVAGGPLAASARRLGTRAGLPVIDPITAAMSRLHAVLHHEPARSIAAR
jgi:allantoin racemase